MLALEVMVVNSAIRSLIREPRTHQIYFVMQASLKHGTQTMSQTLALLARRAITTDEALRHSLLPDEVRQLLSEPGNGGKVGRCRGRAEKADRRRGQSPLARGEGCSGYAG